MQILWWGWTLGGPRSLLGVCLGSCLAQKADGSVEEPSPATPCCPGLGCLAPAIRLTLPPLSLESLSAQKKRLLPIHGWDFEADSDDSDPSCGHPPSLSSVSGATDGLQVSGLSFRP